MAQSFFIKLEGINGDSRADGHRDEIQVLSWSHSFNQPTSAVRFSAGGGTIEQATHSDFTFTKYTDTATTGLLKACWSGKTVKNGVFTAYRSEGDRLVKYLEIEFTGCIVSNFSLGGGAGDLPTETVTLNNSKVRYSYTPAADERGPAQTQSVEHDLSQQKVS